MTKRASILLTVLSMAISPAASGGSVYYAPPLEVYAQRQPYYPPPPAAVYPPPAYALGGLIGRIVSLPFQFIGGIGGALFGAPQYPQAANVSDEMGGLVPQTNSTYDPATGQFIPPDALQPSGPYPSLAPIQEPLPVYHVLRRPSSHTPWKWHDPNPSPEKLPDTRKWVEPK